MVDLHDYVLAFLYWSELSYVKDDTAEWLKRHRDYRRAGVNDVVTHTAVEDDQKVVELVRRRIRR